MALKVDGKVVHESQAEDERKALVVGGRKLLVVGQRQEQLGEREELDRREEELGE